jgi:hypothetical protein
MDRWALLLVLSQALLDKTDAIFSAILEDLLLELGLLAQDCRVESQARLASKIECRVPGENFVCKNSDSKNVRFLRNQRH